MNSEQREKLRAPFKPESIGKLPRVWCKACRDRKGNCDDHRRVRCEVCGNTITQAHLHLDYVGHAEITDRLLAVDPEWTWEPVAFGQDGLPQMGHGGLWIRLTIAGVTRLGFGHADGKTGPDAVKECIGDALRNAAMRFGVGLDLWGATYKGDESSSHEADVDEAEQVDVFDAFTLELQGAKSPADLSATWKAMRKSLGAGHLTKAQHDRLVQIGSAKRAEFDTQETAA